MIKTLYLHENLKYSGKNISKKFILLKTQKDNTHFKFIKIIKFEENWCPIEKPLTDFK